MAGTFTGFYLMEDNKRTDTTALIFALIAATTMIAQQVAGKATRDALFLSNFDVTNLPKVVIAAAIASITGVLIMSRLLSRVSPITLVPVVFGLSAILFIGEWMLLDYQPRAASVILYLHMAIFGAILISGFWSIINERFDPHSAKQRVARIAAAAALGGIIGGILTTQVAKVMDVRTMLLFLSGLHFICLVTVRCIGTPTRIVPIDNAVRTRSAFTVISQTHYLQWMAALMVLVAVMAALIDYAFKSAASAHYQDSESLIAFFGSFYAAIGVIGFVLQSLLGRRILQRFGIGMTIAILPFTIAIFGTIGVLFTYLWSMVMLRGGQAIFANSFFRSAFELLYTPLPPHKKRPTKTIIDVASDRLGDLIGSGLLLLLLFIAPELPTAIVAACAVIVAVLALFVVVRLNRGYINQLAKSLRKGVIRIQEEDIVDATTQEILAESNAYSEREFLQSKIAAMAHPDDVQRDEDVSISEEASQLALVISDLTSGDTGRIRRALGNPAMDISLAHYLIPLLAIGDITEDARTELRWLVSRIPGQLTDALLDPDMPLLVRQRLPGVLEASHSPRAIDGLLRGIVDETFNVRYSCARVLVRMRHRNPHLEIPRQQVYDAISRELKVSPEEWEGRDMELKMDYASDEEDVNPQFNRGLEHVFTLLALTLDPDAVHLSMQAAFSKDLNLRGTALEYLENVLPAYLYNELLEHLGEDQQSGKSMRTLGDIVNELKAVVRTGK
ncbi:MAG: Npt1/Npt2 family nucleotide transporter [Gammaproteobacteria bacterium]|nr:Npt1/Npt2 family nucleotide transporter [Gammaproteobacteria bacterium]